MPWENQNETPSHTDHRIPLRTFIKVTNRSFLWRTLLLTIIQACVYMSCIVWITIAYKYYSIFNIHMATLYSCRPLGRWIFRHCLERRYRSTWCWGSNMQTFPSCSGPLLDASCLIAIHVWWRLQWREIHTLYIPLPLNLSAAQKLWREYLFCTCLYVSIYIYVYIYRYNHIYIHIYICIYMFIYTQVIDGAF